MTSKIEDELYIGDSLSKYIIHNSGQFSHFGEGCRKHGEGENEQ